MECGTIFLFVISTNLFCVATSLSDVALNKSCKQSTTYTQLGVPRVAGFAVDGVIDYEKTCSHTATGDQQPWWEVDLAGIYSIHSVLLRNRGSGGERLGNFTIMVTLEKKRQGTVCKFYEGSIPESTARQVTCDSITLGQFVKISKQTLYLTLCEVQVFVIDRSGLLFEKQVNKIIRGDYLTEEPVITPLRCGVNCQLSPYCLAFGHNNGTGLCRLYSTLETFVGNYGNWSFFIVIVYDADAVVDVAVEGKL